MSQQIYFFLGNLSILKNASSGFTCSSTLSDTIEMNKAKEAQGSRLRVKILLTVISKANNFRSYMLLIKKER